MSLLLPCPFCGSAAEIRSDDGRFFVSCCGTDCFCCVGEGYDASAMPDHIFDTEDAAKAAWNRRVPVAAQAEAAGLAMREACATAADAREQAAEIAQEVFPESAEKWACVAQQMRLLQEDIRALPLPAPALDAIKAEARKQGYREGWNDREGDFLAGVERIVGAAAEKEPKT